MSFPEDDIKAGISLIEEIVGGMRATVFHVHSINDGYGPVPQTPIERKALVEDVAETIIGPDGTTVVSLSKLTFFEPVSVDVDSDEFSIPPSDKMLRVLKVAGLLDPAGVPYMTEVWLGIRR